jgi:hypothetical protein
MEILANTSTSRRRFLRTATMVSLAVGLSAGGIATALPAAANSTNVDAQQTITRVQVSYVTSLRQLPKTVVLPIGSWSDPIIASDRRAYRVKVVPVNFAVKPELGPVFAVILGDVSGNELARINLGDGATGTFADFGVQIDILSMPSGAS